MRRGRGWGRGRPASRVAGGWDGQLLACCSLVSGESWLLRDSVSPLCLRQGEQECTLVFWGLTSPLFSAGIWPRRTGTVPLTPSSVCATTARCRRAP